MEIIRDLSVYKETKPMVISLGMFDGVHRGHLEVLEKVKNIAKEKGYISGVFSFWPHPRKVLEPDFNLHQLTILEEKIKFLEKQNIDLLILQKFDEEFRNLSAEDFIEQILVKKLNVKYIIVGYDHHFGKNKAGNFEVLKSMGEKFNFEVEQVDGLSHLQQKISSTKIRNLLKEGNIQEANDMLGYSYSVSGEVVHGKKIGRTIGYPTANINVDETKLLPKKGAYIVEVWLKGNFYKGMLSVGTNPTVGGERLTVEVYILDFKGDIYGENITIKFREFLHEEIKFESLEKLMEQLDKDKEKTEKFLF